MATRQASDQHTPGPWHVDIDSATGRNTRVRASALGLRDKVCVADVSQGAGDFPRLEANARIIAAAPELLEALKAVTLELAQCRCHRKLTTSEEIALDRARDAIAKAEREQ